MRTEQAIEIVQEAKDILERVPEQSWLCYDLLCKRDGIRMNARGHWLTEKYFRGDYDRMYLIVRGFGPSCIGLPDIYLLDKAIKTLDVNHVTNLADVNAGRVALYNHAKSKERVIAFLDDCLLIQQNYKLSA